MNLTHRWPHTLTLIERSSTLRENGHIPHPANGTPAAQSPRLDEWSSQPPFGPEFPFAQRLEADGLTEDAFARLLNETPEELAARFPEAPAWVSAFTRAWSDDTSAESIPWPKPVTDHNLYGFLQATEPLINRYRDQLRVGIQALVEKYADLPFDPHAIEDILLLPVPDQVLRMAGRTLVLEMHVARLRGQLSGETSEARYQQFFEQLRDPRKLAALFDEYVVLARQLTIYLSEWVETSLEFLQRLCADWQDIQTTFTPDEAPGKLVSFQSGLGDRHGGGRTVGIAQFASGFRLVYKPRPQGITLHFQELLEWLNAHDLPQPFRTMKVLDRGRYGWVEFVSAHACQSVEEITRFYQRQGGYLALLYILSGTDIHAENLIASGEHPVLIDVETLFHPEFSPPDMPGWARPTQPILQSSVQRSLLLPARVFADAEQEGIDMSGLGSAPGQLTPTPVPYWEKPGTDEMRLERKRMPIPGSQNRPMLEEQEIEVLNYLDEVVAGFETVYQLLIRHRAEFLSEAGPLTSFAADEVRVVLRATRTYAILLNEGYHPNLLRDALTRDRLFDYLWRQAAYQPQLREVIAFEKNDLHRGNVPLFSTGPNSRSLWGSSGERLPDFFTESSLAGVQRRVSELNEKDLELQVWFIRASFLSLPEASALQKKSQMASKASALSFTSPSSHAPQLERRRLLDAARAAGDRLEALALHHEDYVGWIEAKVSTEEFRGGITPLGVDLYGGLSGVTLFLAYLEAITGEERYRKLAEKALFTAQSQLEDMLPVVTGIGAFSGWGGSVYFFTHLASLWNRPDLLAETERIVARIAEVVEQDMALDVIAGSAGCIGSLLSLYHYSPSPRVLEVATQCGDHLIAQAKTMDDGVGWLTHILSERPVTGFSHGTTGMAWALSNLAEATGESRFKDTASAALAYERRTFLPETQNWRSLREADGTADDMLAWCYGAPGIGLARLNSPQADAHFQTEIETALQTTHARGFGRNQSLCHGDLGNLELLLQASHKGGAQSHPYLDSAYWQAQVNSVANRILDDIDRRGWVGGMALITVPGLMTGIAGIGYGLLRLAEPQKVPSVLTLEPPTRRVR